MNKRFQKVNREIREFLVDDDAFGLKEKENPFIVQAQVPQRHYQFQTNPQKTATFRKWLQDRINANILSVDVKGKPWTAEYIESAYRKGVTRSFIETQPPAKARSMDFFLGSKREFLRQAFMQPEMLSKIELVATRAFEGLKDITTSMSARLNRILSDGLAHGHSPEKISRAMAKDIGKLTRTRARELARTEIINAHAEGQLDGFERLGIKKTQLRAEWSIAGDDIVCPQCGSMEGRTFTIDQARGLIPFHPNCRCAWIPYVKVRKGQK
jgi:SPP1 gp7 family putative phage head morphogenesis protein